MNHFRQMDQMVASDYTQNGSIEDVGNTRPPPLLSYDRKNDCQSTHHVTGNRYSKIYRVQERESTSKSTFYYSPPHKISRSTSFQGEQHQQMQQYIRRYSADREPRMYSEIIRIPAERRSPDEYRNSKTSLPTPRRPPRHPIFLSADDFRHEQSVADESSHPSNSSPESHRSMYSPHEQRNYRSPASSTSPQSNDEPKRISDEDRSPTDWHIDKGVHYDEANNFHRKYRTSPSVQSNESMGSHITTNPNCFLNFQVIEKKENYVTLFVQVNGRKYEGRLVLNNETVPG